MGVAQSYVQQVVCRRADRSHGLDVYAGETRAAEQLSEPHRRESPPVDVVVTVGGKHERRAREADAVGGEHAMHLLHHSLWPLEILQHLGHHDRVDAAVG